MDSTGACSLHRKLRHLSTTVNSYTTKLTLTHRPISSTGRPKVPNTNKYPHQIVPKIPSFLYPKLFTFPSPQTFFLAIISFPSPPPPPTESPLFFSVHLLRGRAKTKSPKIWEGGFGIPRGMGAGGKDRKERRGRTGRRGGEEFCLSPPESLSRFFPPPFSLSQIRGGGCV